MKDTHIHLENGPYTIEWFEEFVKYALKANLEEIWIVEHSYRFKEFESMYQKIRDNNEYFNQYYLKRGSLYQLNDYLELAQKVRQKDYPLKIKFGLEVCYIEGNEQLIKDIKNLYSIEFLIGSIHFVDNFCFDHSPKLWDGIDIDKTFTKYYESTIKLIESNLFDVLGHPDSIKLFNHRPSIDMTPYYLKIVEALKKSNILVEQNSGIERRSPLKPELGINNQLLSLIVTNNIPITYVSDAHFPEDIGYKLNDLKAIVDNLYENINV